MRRPVVPTVSGPDPEPVAVAAFGLKPHDLGPQLFNLLTARVDGRMGAVMTAHHDPYRQAHPNREGECRRPPQAMTT
jgi:hypothetical protein